MSRAGYIKRPRAYTGRARDVPPANHSDRAADQPEKGARSDRNGRTAITASTNIRTIAEIGEQSKRSRDKGTLGQRYFGQRTSYI